MNQVSALHMPFKVVLDANVLFPFTLRDTLLRAASARLYQAYWSEQILDEVCRNLVERGMLPEKADRLRSEMARSFPEAFVSGHEKLVGAMENDPKDRHVAAAAVAAGAQVIVTSNLRDFHPLPSGIEAQSPDEFLCNLLDLNPDGMLRMVREQATALRRPPRSFDDVLAALMKSVPEFADSLGMHGHSR